MVKVQYFFAFLLQTYIILSECTYSETFSWNTEYTFNNVNVKWCAGSKYLTVPSCVVRKILHSNTLYENIPAQNVTRITISNQNVPVLYENSIVKLKLSSLEIIASGLKEIKEGSLHDVEIGSLDLSDNHIEILSKGIFRNASISTLFLNKNAIKTIEVGTFDDLELFRLELSNNRIEEIKPHVFNNSSVDLLDLSRNKIKFINKGVFKMPKLEGLILDHNEISQISAGSFEELPNLRLLYLNNNLLKDIPVNVFNSKMLLELYFEKNKIKTISPGAFENSSIAFLKLSRNYLEEINAGMFNQCYVDHLILSKNKINNIEPNALDNIHGSVQLDGNNLEIIKKDTLKSIAVVDLLNNKIKQIELEAFKPVKMAIITLYLKKDFLDPESMKYLNNLVQDNQLRWYEELHKQPFILHFSSFVFY